MGLDKITNMNKSLSNLSAQGKEELALALVLWKDFKSQGKIDVPIYKQFIDLAKMLGVREEAEAWLSKLPPLEIKPR